MANNSISSAFIALPKVLWKGFGGSPVECFSPWENAGHSPSDTHGLF